MPGRRPNRGGACAGAAAGPRGGVGVFRRRPAAPRRRRTPQAPRRPASQRCPGWAALARRLRVRDARGRWAVSGWSWAASASGPGWDPWTPSPSWPGTASPTSASCSPILDRLRLGLRLRRRAAPSSSGPPSPGASPFPGGPGARTRSARPGARTHSAGRPGARTHSAGRARGHARRGRSGLRLYRGRLEHHLRRLEDGRRDARRRWVQLSGTAPAPGVVIVFSVVQLALEHSGNLQSGSRARGSAACRPGAAYRGAPAHRTGAHCQHRRRRSRRSGPGLAR